MEFRDLKAQYQKYKTAIDKSIQNSINKGCFIGGEEVVEIENRLANYVGAEHCITCANGTEAMTLAMMAWGIGKGDAVFVPDFTFFSTGEIVSFVGATPIFVDVCQDTFNIDVIKLEETILKIKNEGKLTPKVIIPVNLFGLPADYELINDIAKKYDLKILEDSAQGFGGSIKGKKSCSFGHIATTSFFPAKPLGCYGDGGAIFTDNDELANLISSLKIHGRGVDKYDNVRIGVNSRLDTIQAAILNVKLTAFIDHELEDVNKVAWIYKENLNDVVKIPIVPEGYVSSFAQYTIKLNNREERDMLQKELNRHGVPNMVYYSKPMHKQIAFSYLQYDDNEFKVANNLCDVVLSLPMHPYLTHREIEEVSGIIKSCLSDVRK